MSGNTAKKTAQKTLKKVLTFLLAACIIFSSLPAVIAGTVSIATVPNASFESGSPPTSWTIYSGTWGTQLSKATNRRLDGSYSLKLNDNSSSAGYGIRTSLISANAYATYSAMSGVYVESGSAQIYLEFWDSSSNRIGTQIASMGTASKWQLISAKAQAPAGTEYVSVLLYGHVSNVGVSYFDMVRIDRIDEVPAFQNNSFEGAIDANGEPASWNIYSGAMGTELFVSSDRAYDGTKSFKIVDSSATANRGLRSIPMAAAGGLKYEASAYVYNSSGNAQIYLEFWQSSLNNSSDTRLGTAIASGSGTGSWQKISAIGTAPSGTEYITVLLYSTKDNTGTSYYDNVNARQYYDPGSVSFTPQETSHPRLLFTSSELPDLQSKRFDSSQNQYGTSFSEIWSAIEGAANSYLTETSITNSIPTYGAAVTYQFPLTQPPVLENPPGYTSGRWPYWTWMGSSMMSRLEILSYAYKVTGNIDYANRAKEHGLALAGWPTWCDPTCGTVLSNLDSSYITKGMSAFYDMCYDVLTTAERETVKNAIYEKGIRPIYKELMVEPKSEQNINLVRSAALGIGCLSGLGEEDFYDVYLNRAYEYWMWYLNLRDTSSASEGYNYVALAMNYISQAADYLKRVTGNNNIFTHNYVQNKLSRWVVDFLAPNGNGLPNFSDSSLANYMGTPMYILTNMNDGLAGWYVKEARLGKYGGMLAFNHLKSTGAYTTPEDAGLTGSSIANSYIGYGVLRTGWEQDDQMLAFLSASSTFGHNHFDDNSFVLNVGGEWILTDPGYVNSSSSATQTVTTGTLGHNSMLINGAGQNNRAGGGIVGSFLSPVFDLLIGDASDSYTTGVNDWRRRIIFIKPDYYILQDYVSMSTAAVPEILFHGDTGAQFTSNGTPITIGSVLPSDFTVEKPKASVSIQSLRPSGASRLYTQTTGATMFGTYGSIKSSAATLAESFVTLLRPKVHKQGIIEAESLLPPTSSGGGSCTETIVNGHDCAYYASPGTGDSVTFSFNVASAGQYNFEVDLMKHQYGPIVNVKLDGVVLQSNIDLYADYDLLRLIYSNKSLSAGTHTITFDVTGVNPSSYGKIIPFDCLRLLPVGQTVQTAQPYSVNTVTSGTATGLIVTIDAATSDQLLLNPANTTTYTTSNLTLVSRATQGMMRKTASGEYKRYAIVSTLTTGDNLTDGSQVLVKNIGISGGVALGEQESGIWAGFIRLAAACSPEIFTPSVTQVKLDGVILNTAQYSYNTTTKLLTLNNVSSGDHTIEITQ